MGFLIANIGTAEKFHAGDLDGLTGAVFASWFAVSPNGRPTSFAVGFAETPDMPWSLFYRRMQFTGTKTYLGAAIDEEIAAASGNFFDVFFNLMIGLNNHLAASSIDKPLFSEGAPTFLHTNGNPDVDAALSWLIVNSPALRGNDWGRELYLRETYGTISVSPTGDPFRKAYKRYKQQHHPAEPEETFASWWTAVTDMAYVEPATFQFAQAWVAVERAAKHSGQINASSGGDWMSYSELARFFDNFHMPLLPPEVDERFLLKSLGMR